MRSALALSLALLVAIGFLATAGRANPTCARSCSARALDASSRATRSSSAIRARFRAARTTDIIGPRPDESARREHHVTSTGARQRRGLSRARLPVRRRLLQVGALTATQNPLSTGSCAGVAINFSPRQQLMIQTTS